MSREALVAALSALVLVMASTASAAEETEPAEQSAPAEDAWIPKAQGHRLGGEADWWPDNSKNTFTWGFVGQVRLARVFYLDLDFPVGYRDVGADKTFILGNPTIGAHWADKVTDELGVFAGVAFAMSTFIAGEDDPFDGQIVEQYRPRSAAFESRGGADAQRFLPDSLFLRARAGLEVRILPALFYRLEIAPMGVFALGQSDGGALVDASNEFEGRALNGFGGGLRLQGVAVALGDRDTEIMPSLEPYFTYEPQSGFYARFGTLVVINTRPQSGDVIEGPISWPTIRLAAGAKW